MTTLDTSVIEENTALFSSNVVQSLSAMVGASYEFPRENMSNEPFVSANGVLVVIHFGGVIQGDYLLVLDEQTAFSLTRGTSDPDYHTPIYELRRDTADFLTELLNTAVGQTIQKLEEHYGLLSYVPAVVVFGEMFFPRVLSRTGILTGDFGSIESTLAINLGDMKIARRLGKSQLVRHFLVFRETLR